MSDAETAMIQFRASSGLISCEAINTDGDWDDPATYIFTAHLWGYSMEGLSESSAISMLMKMITSKRNELAVNKLLKDV